MNNTDGCYQCGSCGRIVRSGHVCFCGLRGVKREEMITTTCTAGNDCKHLNGWYHKIPFWIWSREVYACTDCGAVLYGDKLNNWKKAS